MQYRKKPVVIEALKWDGENFDAVNNFTDGAAKKKGKALIIPTLEGNHKASVGDMIIKGVNGEFYPCKPDIFAKTYDDVSKPIKPDFGETFVAAKPVQTMKTLHNSTISGARKNVKDIQVVGNGDMFQLLCKASSEAEGWMKSTKAMTVPGGCIVQITTQQRNPDGSYAVAEALTYAPGAFIGDDVNGGRKLTGRK